MELQVKDGTEYSSIHFSCWPASYLLVKVLQKGDGQPCCISTSTADFSIAWLIFAAASSAIRESQGQPRSATRPFPSNPHVGLPARPTQLLFISCSLLTFELAWSSIFLVFNHSLLQKPRLGKLVRGSWSCNNLPGWRGRLKNWEMANCQLGPVSGLFRARISPRQNYNCCRGYNLQWRPACSQALQNAKHKR